VLGTLQTKSLLDRLFVHNLNIIVNFKIFYLKVLKKGKRMLETNIYQLSTIGYVLLLLQYIVKQKIIKIS